MTDCVCGHLDELLEVRAEVERLRGALAAAEAETKLLRKVKSSDDGAYEHVVEMYHAEAAEVVALRGALTGLYDATASPLSVPFTKITAARAVAAGVLNQGATE